MKIKHPNCSHNVDPIINDNAPKFTTSTNTGKFRQALHDAGFPVVARNSMIYNDARKTSRRLKLWFGEGVVNAPQAALIKLHVELVKQFGDKLISHGSYTPTHSVLNLRSYVVFIRSETAQSSAVQLLTAT